METLRDQWRAGKTSLGLWAGLANPSSAEQLGRAGLDYVCVDTQHGLVDYQAAVGMYPAISYGGTTPICRVPWNEPGIIGKHLDAGAMGIIVPMVNSAEEAQAAVSACRYPPNGARSYGPAGVAPRYPGYYDSTAEQIAVIPMVETVQALGNVEAIVSTPGVDAVYVGPADLSISLGLPPGNNDDVPEFVEALETIVAACSDHGVVAGIHSTGSLTPRRLEMGFRMITVTADNVAMGVGLRAEIAKARSGGDGDGADKMY
ncbi:MAG: aldolase/citrate lyase family protein [Actinomycetota bacterium]